MTVVHRESLFGRTKEYRKKSYGVTYNTKNHIGVLLQMWGSVWPLVLPYCIWNSVIDIIIQLLKEGDILDLTISDKGHTFLNLVMAFLMVSRVNNALNRFREAHKNLNILFTETRELVQQACVYTSDDASDSAQQWRSDLAFSVMALLRAVQAILDYEADGETVWDVLNEELGREIQQKLFLESPRFRHHGEGLVEERGKVEENFRIPHFLVQKLRFVIYSQRSRLSRPLDPLQERALNISVDRFVGGWTGLRYFLTTPHPFPLVQMTLTFLFFYIFTLPFALLSDVTSSEAHVVVIFFLTYGYIGLEFVAVELDEPFGTTENTFDNLAMACTCFEDVYLTILDIDGDFRATSLRERMGEFGGRMSSERNCSDHGGQRTYSRPSELSPLIE